MTTAPSTPEPARSGRRISGTTDATLQRLSIDPTGRLALVTATLWRGGTLQLLQDAVGGTFARLALRGRLDAWVNEDAVRLRLPTNLVATAVCAAVSDGPTPPMLLGTVVFLRNDSDHFTSPTPVQQQLVLDAWRAATQLRPIDPRGAGQRR